MQSSPAASSLPISQQPALKEMAIARSTVRVTCHCTNYKWDAAKRKRPHAQLFFQSKSKDLTIYVSYACKACVRASNPSKTPPASPSPLAIAYAFVLLVVTGWTGDEDDSSESLWNFCLLVKPRGSACMLFHSLFSDDLNLTTVYYCMYI